MSECIRCNEQVDEHASIIAFDGGYGMFIEEPETYVYNGEQYADKIRADTDYKLIDRPSIVPGATFEAPICDKCVGRMAHTYTWLTQAIKGFAPFRFERDANRSEYDITGDSIHCAQCDRALKPVFDIDFDAYPNTQLDDTLWVMLTEGGLVPPKSRLNKPIDIKPNVSIEVPLCGDCAKEFVKDNNLRQLLQMDKDEL